MVFYIKSVIFHRYVPQGAGSRGDSLISSISRSMLSTNETLENEA